MIQELPSAPAWTQFSTRCCSRLIHAFLQTHTDVCFLTIVQPKMVIWLSWLFSKCLLSPIGMLLWPEALGHTGNCAQVSSPTSLCCPQRHHVTFRWDRLKTKWLSRAGRIHSSYCTGFITSAAAFLMLFMPQPDCRLFRYPACSWELVPIHLRDFHSSVTDH